MDYRTLVVRRLIVCDWKKMYRAYGAEFTEEISALEAGMDRFLDLSRGLYRFGEYT